MSAASRAFRDNCGAQDSNKRNEFYLDDSRFEGLVVINSNLAETS
jgi:hypothetical protein